ncbi:helix-turn-helix domain-containing protein [Puteibacter caeruleilacunae]|nr:helix-turn-helix domain-containing protein [Puteibacter caeruleilacunae]
MLKYLTILICFIFIVVPQNILASYVVKSITIDDNLTSNRISSLEIDSLNTLWIGSNLGLNSYCNDNVTNHPFFSGAEIYSIKELSKGKIVVYSNLGVHIYSYVTSKIERIGEKNVKFTGIHIFNNKLYLASANMKVYSYTDSLKVLLDVKALLPDLPKNVFPSKILLTSKGKMFLMLSNYGVVTLNTNNFEIENTYHHQVWKYVDAVELNEQVYVASYLGVFILDAQGNIVKTIDKKSGQLPDNIVMDLLVNHQRNEVWIGLDNFGIYAINNKLEAYDLGALPEYSYLKNRTVTSIQFDKYHNVYTGSVYEGLLIAVDSPFKELVSETVTGKVKPIVLAVHKDTDGKVWCGTDNMGLFSIDSLGNIQRYFKKEYRVINFVEPYSKNELLVIGYNTGAAIFNTKTGKYKPITEINGLAQIGMMPNCKLFTDKEGCKWVFSHRLFRIASDYKSLKEIKDPKGNKFVGLLKFSGDSEGRVWFADKSSFYCYNTETEQYDYTQHLDFKGDQFIALCSGKKDEVVLTTKQDVYRFDLKSNEVQKYPFPFKNKRIVKVLYQAAMDRYVFMTSKDIVVAKISDSISNVSILNTNSLHSRMYFPNSSILLGETIYAGYDGGVCEFNLNEIYQEDRGEKVQTLMIRAENGRFNDRDTSVVLFNGDRDVTFRRSLSDYSITFQGEMIAKQNKVRYLYVLDGLDEEWNSTEINSVTYSKLKPGNYKFRIKSIDNRGLEGKEHVLTIAIKSPLLLSNLFIAIYLLIVLGIVSIVILYYRRKLTSKIVVDWNIPGKKNLEVKDDKNEDEIFIGEFKSVIENNISNCDIHVNEIARELHVSRTVLYEKVKKISGYSVKAFINEVRLKKAKSMLEDPDININDISIECGFNSASYFSTAFKKSFDKSPSKYRNDYLRQVVDQNKN